MARQKSVTWMSQVNGKMEISRGRMVSELLVRPSMEYAAEMWWKGGRGRQEDVVHARSWSQHRLKLEGDCWGKAI